MSRRQKCFCVCIEILYLSFACATTTAGLKSTTIERYDVAVEKAVSFLRSQRSIQPRDKTLVAYALLKAGVDSTEPLLVEGIELAQRRANAARYGRYEDEYVAAVDAMLLADAGGEKYGRELQVISDLMISYQRADGSWHDAGLGPNGPGDVSLTQFCTLALWAAQRSGCRVPPSAFDRTAQYLIDHSNPDGGWTYRITGPTGVGTGGSIHTMTMAGTGTIAIANLLLNSKQETSVDKVKFGVLERAHETKQPVGYPNYRSKTKPEDMAKSIAQGLAWNQARFAAIPPATHLLYFYYTLERTAALTEFQKDWYTIYGDGLLSLQAPDGHFEGYRPAYGPAVGTSFAILYFMRSTQQILEYGAGIQVGGRDLEEFFRGKKTKSELGPLDELLKAMEGQDFSDLDVSTDDLVQKIQFSSREELVGETDKLRVLMQSPDAAKRQIAYWALGRTGDFELIPLMLEGLKDPSIDVNVEALAGLRYIARKPRGLGLNFDPLGKLPRNATDKDRVKTANQWREKALKAWQSWYAGVRPYESSDGLDE
jgi:hypothetical protein